MLYVLIGLALLGFFAFLANIVQGTVELLKVGLPYILGFIFLLFIIACICGA